MKSKGFAWIFLIEAVAMLALICVLVYKMGEAPCRPHDIS